MEPFTLPESLAALSAADLAALETRAVEEFDKIKAIPDDDLTDAHISDMEHLASDIKTLRAEKVARAAASAARKERAAAARDLVSATIEEPEPEEAVEEPPAKEAVVKKEDKTPALRADGGDVVTGPVITSVATIEKKDPVRPRPATRILAAADVPGYATASAMDDLDAVAKAFSNRANAFPRGHVPDTYIRSGVATIERHFDDGLIDTNRDFIDGDSLVAEAVRESRLPGGSLVAAGGWCAPSVTLYDLCTTETLDGLITLPTIGITRGGIKFTRGPAFSDIYTNAGFCFTEAEVISGVTKPCVEIACPPFQDVRLDVCGICVKAPILTNVGYPELVRRWVEGSLVAQQHKESARVIAAMAAAAGTAQTITGGAGSGLDALAAIEWSVVSQRYKYRASLSQSFEGVAPVWAKAIIRADLALRQGRDTIQVSDADIDAYFAARGVVFQWVYDWQPLDVASAANGCLATAPATFDVLIYPAGTFIKGTADVINVDSVYDSTLLQSNMFVAVFVESGILVANRCYDACRLTIPVCISGSTGGALTGCVPIGDAVAGP